MRGVSWRFIVQFLVVCFIVEGPKIFAESDAYREAALASHRKMISELDRVEEEVLSSNLFLGRVMIDRIEGKLKELPDDAHPFIRGKMLGYLGYYQLCFGLQEEAIANLEKARSLFPKASGKDKHPELVVIEGSLSLAYLRMAENQNCCAKPNPDSCIFPIRGMGIHEREEGAEKALALLKESIAIRPRDVTAGYEEKWLANLALMILGRSSEELPPKWRLPAGYTQPKTSTDFPEFTNVAAKAGVDTFGLAGGAIGDDFDGDGFHDIVISNWDPAVAMKYFKGKGDGTFEEITQKTNLSGIRGGLNMKQGDFDNDGDLDIYVLRGGWLGDQGKHPNSLLRNNYIETGDVSFTDVTFAVGLGDDFFPTQTGDWADFDLDGDLDLFVAAEGSRGRFPCRLYRNDGPNGQGIPRFTDITNQAGIQTFRRVKGMTWGDYDGDRYPDIYLSCINEANVFWKNLGDGTFRDITYQTNTGMPERSFPTFFLDYNNDGFLDLFVSDYTGEGFKQFLHARDELTVGAYLCRLYENDGKGGFRRAEEGAGLTMPMLPMGCNYGDLTNDGFQDLYLGTGNPSFSSIVPNLLLSNEGGKFVNRTSESRLGHLQKGHGVAMADFDRDGDLDIFEQMGGAYRCDPYFDALYENPGNKNHWISIRLKGRASNHFGVGSRVRVVVKEGGQERSIYQWMNSGSSFGGNPLELHFGLAQADSISRIEISWPATGKTQVVGDAKLNQRITIVEE